MRMCGLEITKVNTYFPRVINYIGCWVINSAFTQNLFLNVIWIFSKGCETISSMKVTLVTSKYKMDQIRSKYLYRFLYSNRYQISYILISRISIWYRWRTISAIELIFNYFQCQYNFNWITGEGFILIMLILIIFAQGTLTL